MPVPVQMHILWSIWLKGWVVCLSKQRFIYIWRIGLLNSMMNDDDVTTSFFSFSTVQTNEHVLHWYENKSHFQSQLPLAILPVRHLAYTGLYIR